MNSKWNIAEASSVSERLSVKRRLLYFLYIAFFRFTPEDYRPYALFFPQLRQLLVRGFAASSGRNLRVKHNADISPFIQVGDDSELGQHSLIHSHVTIGSKVIMGPNVKIYSRNHNFEDLTVPIADQGKCQLETTIGDDVWIGANVVIVAGINVGSHSVIAAGTIVTRDIEPYAVVGGNPAKVIRSRR